MIQFYHQNGSFNKKTVALEVPNKDTLMRMLTVGQRNLKLKIGETRVHPKDNYVKKIGRELSTQRLQEKLFKLSSVHLTDTHLLFTLNENENRFSKISLKVFYHKSKVYFIEA